MKATDGRNCSKCGGFKPREYFNRDSTKADGMYPKCKVCRGIRWSHRGGIGYRLETERKVTESGCWEWTTYKTPLGYGRAHINGKLQLVHRAAYEYYVGPFDKSLFVCHKCDNPSCFNPDHLFLGTAQDNVDDMIVKGRQKLGRVRVGEQCKASKLTADDVRKIRADSRLQRVIGSEYKITQGQVSAIKRRAAWAHVA